MRLQLQVPGAGRNGSKRVVRRPQGAGRARPGARGEGITRPGVELAGMPLTSAVPSGRVGRVVAAVLLVGVTLVGVRLGTPAQAAGDPVLLAAGDVGTCNVTGQLVGSPATAKLLSADPPATAAMLVAAAYDL